MESVTLLVRAINKDEIVTSCSLALEDLYTMWTKSDR